MRCCLLAICLSASRREAISGGALVFTEADWNFITQFPFSSIARVPVFPKNELPDWKAVIAKIHTCIEEAS
jgi:hypothetical protein